MGPKPKRYQQQRCLHFITFSCYRRMQLLDSEAGPLSPSLAVPAAVLVFVVCAADAQAPTIKTALKAVPASKTRPC